MISRAILTYNQEHPDSRPDGIALHDDLYVVGGQHLQRDPFGRPGKRMGILTHEQRPRDPPRAPVLTNSLRYGQNVRFGECAIRTSAAMAAGTEADPLVRIVRIGFGLVKSSLQPGKID